MSIQAVAWVLEVETTTSGTDRLVLIALANHASWNPHRSRWEAWPGKAAIGREAGVRKDETVREALARLEGRGLIGREVKGAPDHGQRADRRANLYVVNAPPPPGESPATTPPQTVHDSPPNGVHDSPPAGDRTVSSNHQEPSNLTLAAPDLCGPDHFEAFWRIYPRKTAKGDARKAWEGALRKATVVVIITGAERFRDDPNREEQFTPYPATWLRGERWADPPLPSRASRGSETKAKPLDEDRDRPSGRLYL